MSKYGEPWLLWTSCSWLRVMDCFGRPAIVPTRSQADGHPDMYPAERIDRAVQCVNACAGIEDPKAAIDAARRHLGIMTELVELKAGNDEMLAGEIADARRALALLTPEES